MLSHLPPAPTSPTTGMQDLGGTNASGAECQERTCVCGILDSQRLFDKNSNEFRSITRTIKTSITALDQKTTKDSDKTFEGGCKFLLDWYRTTFPI